MEGPDTDLALQSVQRLKTCADHLVKGDLHILPPVSQRGTADSSSCSLARGMGVFVSMCTVEIPNVLWSVYQGLCFVCVLRTICISMWIVSSVCTHIVCSVFEGACGSNSVVLLLLRVAGGRHPSFTPFPWAPDLVGRCRIHEPTRPPDSYGVTTAVTNFNVKRFRVIFARCNYCRLLRCN